MAINFLNSINLNKNELFQARIENQGNDAGAGPSPVAGQLYYNTTDNVLKVYNSISWVEVGGGVTTLSTTDSTFINLTPNTAVTGAVTVTAALSATGTPDNTKYLRGDNTWSPVSGIYSFNVSDGTTSSQILNAETVTFNGTANEVTVEQSPSKTIKIGLPDNVTVTGILTVSGTGQSSFGGQVTIPLTPTASTDAASKNYVDQSNTGQSVFQGGYDAATNVPDLDVTPSSLIKKGWFWAVTVTGSFFSEVVQPGDLIYANIDNPGATFANWTVVQSGQDIASQGATDIATTKGVAGFNSAHFNVTANGWVSSDIYGGGSTLGIVPSGGVSTTFLRGDGTWVTPTGTYVLPSATSSILGGVKLFSDTPATGVLAVTSTASRTYGVQVNASGQLAVNVPWVDTNSITSVSASATNNRLGLAITPTTGAVVAGLSIDTLTDITTDAATSDSLPIYDLSATTNKRVTVGNLANASNVLTTAIGSILAGNLSGTVTHALGINTIVQTVDSTGATVFCDVTRTATTVVATVSAIQANPITILVQKIG